MPSDRILSINALGSNLPGKSWLVFERPGKKVSINPSSCRVDRNDVTEEQVVVQLPNTTYTFRGQFQVEEIAIPPELPEMTLYSQNDPRYKNLVYAGGETFGQAGCYTVCVAMMLSLTGYTDEPPEVARKMQETNCFSGALLARPDRIPLTYPKMRYEGPTDVSKDGPLRWHDTKANMQTVWAELKKGPVIMEVDFRPTTREFNQHFVIALWYDEEKQDILIADPWDGKKVFLMDRYALTWYILRGHAPKLENAICGLRLLRPT